MVQYCRTTFFQISVQQERITELLEHLDKKELRTSNYYEKQRYFLTEILEYATDAKAAIIEYLSVYRPDLLSGDKADLIKELPAYNEFRQLFEEINNTNNKPETKVIEPINLKEKPKSPGLIFCNTQERQKVLELLSPYFPGQDELLSAALQNELKAEQLTFSGSAKHLVEFFRRLGYNRILLNTKSEIKHWLSMVYYTDKGVIKPLKSETVEQYLYKEVGELSKNKRIGSEIYPYFNHQQQKDLNVFD